jgi:N-acetyl sugar amidotransferase
MQTCTRCVLDSTIKGISFNEKGVCKFCEEFDKATTVEMSKDEKKNALNSLVKKIQADGKGKEYDCIIGLSGGVDSSYVAYLTKQFGLRPLAIHLDNGWNAELAVNNIENICNKLKIDLSTYVINWQEFKDLQIAFLKASVANAETPTDHAIFASLYKLARKFNIKYILDGNNKNTEFVRKELTSGGYAYTDLSQIKDIHRRFGKVKLKTFPMMGMLNKFFKNKFFGIKQISILNYTDYNKFDAVEVLKKEFEWKPYDGKHHESVFTKWHQLVYLPRKFNFDKRKVHLSDLVLSKQMSRDEALSELEKKTVTDLDLQQLEEYIQKKLGLSEVEYSQIMNAPPRDFTDYRNSKWIINLYYRLKN